MTEPRLASTRQAAARLGMAYQAFLQLRKTPTFPRPVMQRKHHLWWDMKAIENYFDTLGNLSPKSREADMIKALGMHYGNDKSEIFSGSRA